MEVREIEFEGYENCFELKIDNQKMIVVTGVGPRILSFNINDGDNVLFIDKKKKLGLYDFKVYGGHRFWISPETMDTYNPDNTPCKVHHVAGEFRVTQFDEKTGFEKNLVIFEKRNRFQVKHVLVNKSEMLYTRGAWALTCIPTEGTIFFPWGTTGTWKIKKILYWQKWPGQKTDINSSQYVEGEDLFMIRPTGEVGKVGTAGHEGFVGVSNKNYTFVKKFNYMLGNSYPDDNCAIEIYTSKQFCELETLSPLVTLIPHHPLVHFEEWILADHYINPENGKAIRELL